MDCHCGQERLHTDRKRLQQILLNLISNAIKYNQPNGEVRVYCNRIADSRVRITVEDNGKGIAYDKQPLVFQSFNRLGAERSHIEGSGIGLYLCKELTKLLDGEINFKSHPNKGSIFWVEFEEATR